MTQWARLLFIGLVISVAHLSLALRSSREQVQEGSSGGVGERRYVALGRGNSGLGRSPRTEAFVAGADSDIMSDSLLALTRSSSPVTRVEFPPTKAASHVQFERPRLERGPRNASRQA